MAYWLLAAAVAGALLVWLLRRMLVAGTKMATSSEPRTEEREPRASRDGESRGVGVTEGALAAAGRPLRTHPLYKTIAALSGQVNAMRTAEVKEMLKKRGLVSRCVVLSKFVVGVV